MIPDFTEKKALYDMPTNTYKMLNNKIVGFIDGKEAYIQAINLILNIERFDYVIYSWNYGVELKNLFGQTMTYTICDGKRRIREALIADKRTIDVTDFTHSFYKNKLTYSFVVNSIYGDVNITKEVLMT